MLSPPISSSTSVNNDGLALRSSIKKFLELKEEDFVIGVVAYDERVRSRFIEALGPPDGGPSKVDEFGIATICIQGSKTDRNGRIVLAVSPEFTHEMKLDQAKMKNLRTWVKKSFGEDQVKTYAHFDALLYLHPADQLTGKHFSLVRYRDDLIKLVSEEEKYRKNRDSCSPNLRRFRLVLVKNSHTDNELDGKNFEEFSNVFLLDGSSHITLPEDASAFVATIANDEVENIIRNLERKFQEVDKNQPEEFKEPWREIVSLFVKLISHEKSENLRATIEQQFKNMGELMKKAQSDVGQSLIAFITRKARRLLEAAMQHALVLYRKVLINAAGHGFVSMKRINFYKGETGRENRIEASGQDSVRSAA
ncbi:hypothetical protein D9756_008615 [Leucocoprinus leucothites]|uniref:Uncharacterized protein n=1 Tax=Leucocoprinus leucothites TaxID=201217 RepID=A0A8H5CYS4_9AGAR|nr:hypothetical protein D9756_008615 [Leucoagaricus leucothites]